MIVCYELHLFSAAEQWENSMESFLTESEQTLSRQVQFFPLHFSFLCVIEHKKMENIQIPQQI